MSANRKSVHTKGKAGYTGAMKRFVLIPATLSILASAALLSGCGMGDNVAKIGGDVKISNDMYDRWLKTTSTIAASEIVPDPPEYKKCIAAQRKNAGQRATESSLKQLCESQDKALRQQTLQQLITLGWVVAQAKQDGLKANEKVVQQQASELRRQYKQIDGGVNAEDLKWMAEANVLQQQLRQKAATKQGGKPTEQQLRAFYAKKKDLFEQPATRDVYLLLAATDKQASAAAAALKAGQNWNTVFKRYNDNKLWNSQTALLKNVSPNSWLPELRKVIFSAPVGQVVGPTSIKPLRAYSVVQVKASRAGKAAPSFEKSRATVEQAYLADQAAQKGEAAVSALATKWQPETTCAKDYESWYPCKGTKKSQPLG